MKSFFEPQVIAQLIENNNESWCVVELKTSGARGILTGIEEVAALPNDYHFLSVIPALRPSHLGNRQFMAAHRTQYPYIIGEMANGIASADMVVAACKQGILAFFGAGGLVPKVVEDNIQKIQSELQGVPHGWGANLIHSPHEPKIEEDVVELYLKMGVKNVCASAYLGLTPFVLHYAFKGIYQDANGNIVRPNNVLAKISREEIAQVFASPPPADMLQALVANGKLTAQEAQLAAAIPIAQDITAEADSGGHTDNRAATVLFPLIQNCVATINQRYQYVTPVRVGLAGGIGCPEALASAFTMGADYVLTGTVNETAKESGLSEQGRQLMADAQMSDVMMAAAADMFEMGVKLQVLKKGSMFGMRANQLYQYYREYDSLESLPPAIQEQLVATVFKKSLADIWNMTESYFLQRDPVQVEKAHADSKYKMALVFRWYLGHSSFWANSGEAERVSDYQIWCGPCIGAFNNWVKDSCLEPLETRSVVDIALNLLHCGVKVLRAQQCRQWGVPVPSVQFKPVTIPHTS